MDTPFQNPNQGNNQSGGANVPPPPPPPLSIRTMDSDVKSIAQSGGNEPKPEFLNVDRPKPPTPPPPPSASEVKIGLPGYTGPEEKMFAPENLPVETETEGETRGGKLSSKSIIVIVLLAVFAIGLGLVGYYVVYPLLFPGTPPSGNNQPAATSTTSANTSTPTAISHRSYISSDRQQVALSVNQASLESTSTPILKEIILKDANNNSIALSTYLPGILPEITQTDLTSFEQDFTAFVYYDKDGIWPGYVLKAKSASQFAAQALGPKLETLSDLGNLFFANPGAKAADGFKNGQVNNMPSRYITFAKKGSALSFTWLNNGYFLVSASYAGAQKAAQSILP